MVLETYNEIVVVGGYEINDQQLVPSADVWGYARVARDGHAHPGWEMRASAPYPIAGSAISKTGQSHLVMIGGNRATVTLNNLLDGRQAIKAESEVWAFHDPFSVWNKIGETKSPAFDGLLTAVGGDRYLWIDGKKESRTVESAHELEFLASTKTMSFIDWVVVGLYFLVVAGIGYYFSKKQTGAASFAIGGGNTKWWATALSLMASGVSTISFMALPALAACTGMAGKGPMLFMFIGMWVSAHITFPILRRLNITSTFEYVEQRFGVSLRLVGSFVSIITQLMGRIGIVVMLPALAISTMVGIDPWISILAMGIITTIYSAVGGFEAVIWTDVVQGILLIGGFIFIGILAIVRIDGHFGTLMAYAEELNRLNFFLTEFDVTIGNMWFAMLGMILGTLQFASDQVTAQRVLATPLKDVRKMAYMSGFFGVFTAFLSGFVGLALFGFFKDNPEMMSPVMKNDQLVPIFIVNEVPVGLAGLILAALFAAAMSTVSSSVNVCGVLIGEDFYKRLFKNTTEKSEMRVMQVVTVISGFIGTGVALWLVSMDMPTLWESFVRIMSYVGGGFGAVFILGMFTRRTHEYGAIFGVVAGYGMAMYLNSSSFNVHYSALGLIITMFSVVGGYVFSLIVPCKAKPLTGLTIFDQVEDRVSEGDLLKDVG
jgi:SSS family transporter